ncbi:hypothetical protein Tco_1237494 [Tanacetum coccineum]
MSQPANDVFSQHLSDDEASFHEDASDNGTASNKPKQQQQQLIPTTTTILNIKLPILKKKEYDIWAMEMKHCLKYIDNDVWKAIQNGNSKKRISTGKDDCDFYEKKMAREAELKKQRVFNAGNRVDHPLKNMEDRGIFNSGCSAHMTGNQVGFLKKPEESTGFAEIVDFIKDGAGTDRSSYDTTSPSKPLTHLSSPPPVISAITGSEPTPVVESTSHTNSLSPEPDNEPIEHTFEQPSSEHQPLLPKQETEIPQS